MSEPRRIQLSRAKGWRLADQSTNCQIVDRRGIWGNPWTVHPAGKRWMVLLEATWPVRGQFNTNVEARRFAVTEYRRWLTDRQYAAQMKEMGRGWVLDHIGDLAGKDLACWCPLPAEGDDWCHASVLLSLANGGVR